MTKLNVKLSAALCVLFHNILNGYDGTWEINEMMTLNDRKT